MHTFYVQEYALYRIFDLSRDCYVESYDAGSASYEPINDIGKFATIDAAQAACDEYARKEWGSTGWFEIVSANNGPDSAMSRHVNVTEFDENDDYIDTVYNVDSMPSHVLQAMDRVTRSYQAWKDYRSTDWVDLPMAIKESGKHELVAISGCNTPYNEMEFENGYLYDLTGCTYMEKDEYGIPHAVDTIYQADIVFTEALSEDRDEWERMARESAGGNGFELGEYLDDFKPGTDLHGMCAFRIID